MTGFTSDVCPLPHRSCFRAHRRDQAFCSSYFFSHGGATFPSHADLIFTNYSSTNLLKVMAVGDSITDDCSVNGAG